MQKYKYQLHIHTTPCSACAQMSPSEMCKALYEGGYQGAVLTNHFYHGNTGIDRGEPWKSLVAAYERDYEECVQEAKKYDLDILFGIEEGIGAGLEILCYGITPKILYDHPQLRDCPIEDWVQIMRRNDVVLIQAHPFREVWYIPQPRVLPLEYIDGLEVYNRGNATKEMNEKAENFARLHADLLMTSGGDSHRANDVAIGGIETDFRLRTSEDLVKCLRGKQYRLLSE